MWLVSWCFFFFKRKTAYEMRISDWSSDVCSSDRGHDGLIISVIGYYDERSGERAPTEIDGIAVRGRLADLIQDIRAGQVDQVIVALPWSAEGRLQEVVGQLALTPEIGRASGRERVCQ